MQPRAIGAVGRRRRDACTGRWPSGIGARATGSARSGSTDGRSCRTSSWTGKWPGGARDGVPLVVDEADRIVWVAGHGIDEAFRVTDPAQAVIILRLKAVCGRLCVNSTLKSLLFWMVLVVVGVLIWNFSTKFQQHERTRHVQRVHVVGRRRATSRASTITGQDITGVTKANETFPHLRARRSTKASSTS